MYRACNVMQCVCDICMYVCVHLCIHVYMYVCMYACVFSERCRLNTCTDKRYHVMSKHMQMCGWPS